MSRKDDAETRRPRFIQHEDFSSNWDRLGLDDDDLVRLEAAIANLPTAGVVIKGAGGARKIRLALPGRGKSGGVRVIYATFVVHRVVALIDVFAKSEKDNLTRAELAQRAETVAEIKKALDEEKRHGQAKK